MIPPTESEGRRFVPYRPHVPVVLRVYATTDLGYLPEPTWLAGFDVEAHDGRGEASYTNDREEAYRFVDAHDAMREWRRIPTVRRTRPDGRPNRPLTALTVGIEPADLPASS